MTKSNEKNGNELKYVFRVLKGDDVKVLRQKEKNKKQTVTAPLGVLDNIPPPLLDLN